MHAYRFVIPSFIQTLRGVFGLFLFLSLTACSSDGDSTAAPSSYPQSENKYQDNQHGSLFDGGITLFSTGDSAKGTSGGAGGLGVNGFLWRAALDTIAFMPIVSADPIGGLIITDWYSPPNMPDERVKMNILILDRDLRADGVKVTVFRQQKTETGQWLDEPSAAPTATSLEDTILSKARELRVAYESTSK